jgi:hypothetical protein
LDEVIEATGLTDRDAYVGYHREIRSMLASLGRGSREQNQPRNRAFDQSSALTIQNNNFILNQIIVPSPYLLELNGALDGGAIDAPTIVERLYGRMVYRQPSEVERAAAIQRIDDFGEQGIRDVFWSLINHPDFLFR